MTRGSAFPWLTARPIAHRGLHDVAAGVIENSLSAAEAAAKAGYAIECDVQSTLDGEVVVFHDETLERLTEGEGRLGEKTFAELKRLSLRDTRDGVPLLRDFLDALGAAVPLVIEIKSRFDGDVSLARRVAEIVADYRGPVAIESFDPVPIAEFRARGDRFGVAGVPLGIVAQAAYDDADWSALQPAQKSELAHFLHYPRTRPDFVSWNVADLPHAIPLLCREGAGLPLTVWTVRSHEQAKSAASWADQIVFEGFTP
ncbi:MAG: glycerophosphodiester phosphodiesterase [Methylocystaceae bacterium]|nr:MAG: glycerophosphodiester phosphodiesterase [Methylocystaceae bacterium]